MEKPRATARLSVALCALNIGLATVALSAPVDAGYVQTNLVSNIPGAAQFTDPQLRNAWGMSSSPTSPIWVSDNFNGLATLYNGAGVKQGLVVTIAPPLGSPLGTKASPTGQVFNPTANFNGERFIFATEDGTISGFNGTTTTIINVDNSAAGAVYKGIAINTASTLLYAANFGAGKIDVFNSTPGSANFGSVNLGAGAFTDPNLPSGYAPFNIQDLGGSLYVAYAVVNPASPGDDLPGLGNGIVDVYNEMGGQQRRLITGGTLDSPWGLTLASANFGEYSNDLLVGNFGNGFIHAFNPTTGAAVGTLEDFKGNPIDIDGLWGLKFGTGMGNGGSPNALYFTAGPNGETNGLFGTLTVPEPATTALLGIGLAALAGMRRRTLARADA